MYEISTKFPPIFSQTLYSLAKNKIYLTALAGYTFITYASGGKNLAGKRLKIGMADWLPTYLHRENGADIDDAGLIVGAVAVIGGLGGTIIGGILSEKLKAYIRLPYLAVSGVSLIPAVLLAFVILYAVQRLWEMYGKVLIKI